MFVLKTYFILFLFWIDFIGNNRISKAIEGVHEGGIFSLCVMKDGSVLSGGGKDKKVIQYDSSYTKTGVETEVRRVVRAIDCFRRKTSNFLAFD